MSVIPLISKSHLGVTYEISFWPKKNK